MPVTLKQFYNVQIYFVFSSDGIPSLQTGQQFNKVTCQIWNPPQIHKTALDLQPTRD